MTNGEYISGGLQDVIKNLYLDYDGKVKSKLAEQGFAISCVKGCSHCCYLYALITLPEAMYIAYEMIKWPDWRDRAILLKSLAAQMTIPHMTKEKWFSYHIPCAFLDAGLCKIYDVRPSCCRYHFVITSPSLCSIEAPESVKVGQIDLLFIQVHFIELAMHLHKQDPRHFGSFAIGPIPLMIIFALSKMLLGARDRQFLRTLRIDLPFPHEWSKKAIKTL